MLYEKAAVEGEDRGQVEVHLRHLPRVGNPGAGPRSHARSGGKQRGWIESPVTQGGEIEER